MILGSGRCLCLNSATHPDTLQNNSAIGSLIGFSPGTGAACNSWMLLAVPRFMILIFVFPPVPICSTSTIFPNNGISHLNLPRFVSEYSRSLEAGGFESMKRESGRLTWWYGITALVRRYIDWRDQLRSYLTMIARLQSI